MTTRAAAGWVAFFVFVAAAGSGVFGDGAEQDGDGRRTAANGDERVRDRAARAERRRGGRSRTRSGTVTATIARVVDGDTVVAIVGGRRERVRYIGVDTPESVAPGRPRECFGAAAAGFNAELVSGRRVRLRFDAERRDHYGRLLAYVSVGGREVNAELLRRGYARTLAIAPNTARARRFAQLEAGARRAGRGLWGSCRGER